MELVQHKRRGIGYRKAQAAVRKCYHRVHKLVRFRVRKQGCSSQKLDVPWN